MKCNFCKTEIQGLERWCMYHMDSYKIVICEKCNNKFQHELLKFIEEFCEKIDKDGESDVL